MQNIFIRPNESGTVIPNCGLDRPTDKIRQLFNMSIYDFHASFSSRTSPARWLYYILSNQKHIQAKIHTLETQLVRTKENCTLQSIRLRTSIYESTGSLPESEVVMLNERLTRMESLIENLNVIQQRMKIPNEHISRLKTLRINRVEEYIATHSEFRNEVKLALLAGGIKTVPSDRLSKVMAYFVSLIPPRRLRIQMDFELTEKIKEAVAPNLPQELQGVILQILLQPNLWEILRLKKPSLSVSMELYPVLIRFLREFDKFRMSHAGLISGIEKLKMNIKLHEEQFTNSVINAQISELVDEGLVEAYPVFVNECITKPSVRP